MKRLPNGAKLTVRWSDLGSPKQPGDYSIAALGGRVTIQQSDIDNYNHIGGNPFVSITNIKSATDIENNWTVGTFETGRVG